MEITERSNHSGLYCITCQTEYGTIIIEYGRFGRFCICVVDDGHDILFNSDLYNDEISETNFANYHDTELLESKIVDHVISVLRLLRTKPLTMKRSI